jgi:hypothetical protein
MVSVTRVLLDILKPHSPNALEFAQAIAEVGKDYHVRLTVVGMDENTETLMVEVTGTTIDFEGIRTAINSLGGSLHSVDEVEVQGCPDQEPKV